MTIQRPQPFLVIFFLLSFSLQGQVDFGNLNFLSKEGISSKQAITSFSQDERGQIWISTYGGGLSRFDGINYTSYKHDWQDSTSLNSNLVYASFIDSKGRLWAGTDSGINLYNKSLDKFEPVHLQSDFGLSQHFNARRFIECESGYIYVSTYGSGLLKIDPDQYSVSRVPVAEGLGALQVNAMLKNSKGEVLLGTTSGVMALTNEGIVAVNSTEITRHLNVESMAIGPQDQLWLGTWRSGVIRLTSLNDKPVVQKFSITDKKILSMLSIGDKVLVGTENDGLIILDQNGDVLKHYLHNHLDDRSIGSNSVWALYKDSQSRIWAGYYNAGVEVHDEAHNKFGSIQAIANDKNSLQAAMVTGISKDSSGRLWISLGSGIDIYDPKTGEIEHIYGGEDGKYKGLGKNLSAETIFVDSHDNVWVGTWGNGLYLLKKGSSSFINYNFQNSQSANPTNSMLSFAEDTRGRVWIASFMAGVHYYDPETGQFNYCNSEPFQKSGLTNADIGYLITDSKGNIWAGSSFGLYKLSYDDEGDFKISHITRATGVSDSHPSIDRISTIYEAKDGRIWVGSRGAGLLSLDPEAETIHPYGNDPILRTTTINGIIESNDGALWVSGESGIFKLDNENAEVVHFTEADGLLSNYFNVGSCEKMENGTLYFGSYNGINFIDPNDIRINQRSPKLYFTNFKLFNKEVIPGKDDSPIDQVISETRELTLNHAQSVFTLEYMGTSLTRPEKNQYAYMLEGFNKDWNYVGSTRSATYTNLKPGDYTFRIKVANNDGIWSDQILELKINVLPPWWKHNLAYTSYFIILLIAVFAITSFSRRRFREKQAFLLEKERRTQEEDLHQAKLKFFTNISHEFRTPLTLIINPITDIIKNYQNQLPEDVRQKNEVIRKNSDRLSRLINELMDFRKLESNKLQLKVEHIDLVLKTQDLLGFFYEEASRRSINLKFNTSLPKLEGWVDQGMLEKILFNVLSNAFKVTPEFGEVAVEVNKGSLTIINPITGIEEETPTFQLSIKDTGPGIDQKEYKQIFKRFYQVAQLNNDYYGSSGVGLEMVKSFVELHNGKILVDSELNEGTRFTIHLPYDRSFFTDDQVLKVDESSGRFLPEESGQAQENFRIKPEEVAEPLEKAPTVLVVEDNIELQSYLKNELKKTYQVLVAFNGKDGLEIALKKCPDLIITDVVMPVMDGFELCRRVKNDIKTSHIPVLMLTAKGMVEDRIRGIDLGADAYLSKPFDIRELKSTASQLSKSRQLLFNKYFSAISNGEENIASLDKQFIQKVMDYINHNITDPGLSVDVLASELNLSRSQFYRKIKSLTDRTAVEFVRNIRLQKAKKMIEGGNTKINDVCYQVGFSTPSYFSKCFKNEFGILPTQLIQSDKNPEQY